MNQNHKRKRSAVDDSDDEEPALGKQVLPVANLPHDFSGEPMDGLQYLFTVRRDARTLPHVTRVPNPYELKEESKEAEVRLAAPHHALPLDEWREIFLKRLMNFRKNSMQCSIHVGLPSGSVSQKIIPEMKGRNSWWAFISGRPESEWNPPKKSKTQKQRCQSRGMRAFSDDSRGLEGPSAQTYRLNEEGEIELATASEAEGFLPTPSGTPAPESGPSTAEQESSTALPNAPSHAHKPREPTPLLLKPIDHRYALHLLMYFTHWINLHSEQPQDQVSRITETHARWIFVLLSRVDDHVSADEMSLLRSLARACMALLKQSLLLSKRPAEQESYSEPSLMDKTDMSESSCWIVITAIIGIWGQRDLWSDAEQILADVEN